MNLGTVRVIERKELSLFFASPIGYLFLAVFLAFTLFVFFWAEAFFARNISDVRPMFEWLPLLLIFLCAAITMRMWSEERRTGTVEFVLTLPATSWEFVLGKFLACWILLGIALLLTLPIPLSVAFIGELDWGPVLAGYLAAMLLGAAYLAIGLYVSARTDSQIVALIGASVVSGLVYLIGSDLLTSLFGGAVADWMRALGSGTRFESITRGVLDVRDLYYYVSIAIAFLALNVYALERSRWAADGSPSHHRGWQLGTALVVLNALLANAWLSQVNVLRFDMTEGRIYSISPATQAYLDQLREPLLIRGYFSGTTHPLLAPLVPRMQDLLKEYEVAGNGRVKVELVDPADDAELEDEANTKYGIRPVPFQMADRYQASLVNSYFDVLISYGDEYEVLGFRDLIEIKATSEQDFDVQLRNPEFDVTRSIKKVLYGFQGGDSVFQSVTQPVRFTGYLSGNERLPEELVTLRGALDEALAELAQEGGERFSYEIVDPDADGGAVAQEIAERYGLQPMALSLFDPTTFYFYFTLSAGETTVLVPLPDGQSAESMKKGLEEGLKRFATGLVKSVALVVPAAQAPPNFMQQMPQGNQFNDLREVLGSDFNVVDADLESGAVPADAEALLVVDPTGLSEKAVFAIDQYLMQGGTVVLATSPFGTTVSQQSLTAMPRTSGLEDWLAHHGVSITSSLVMDPQNAQFPVPVTREAGGFRFQELAMLDYPYFIDVRADGMAEGSPILQSLPQVTLPWASPIEIAESSAAGESTDAADGGAQVTRLLTSSAGSWLSESTDVMPRVTADGLSGFAPTGETGARLIAAGLEGRFSSYFAGKPSPLLASEEADAAEGAEAEAEAEADAEAETAPEATTLTVGSVIDRSPESARLFVFASNDFLADQTMRMIGSADGRVYGGSLQLMTNLVDWALEDVSLTAIRARGNFNRTLPPMQQQAQAVVEYVNYGFALLGVAIVAFVYSRLRSGRRRVASAWLGEAHA